ncbi:LCP family protein [Candidatus Saccharibacteria bacterium]|nr:LCP family protein [Candidatus Saccharibacteria bacterium]
MDDKQKRPVWGRKSPPSIDGMVRSGRDLGVPVSRSYQPNRQQPTPTLGNLSGQTDGFHPSRQTARGADSAEAAEAHLLDEPIVLDQIETKKRKLRFWQRHVKLKKLIKRTALAFAILVLAGGGYFAYKLYHTQKKVLAGGGKAATVCTDDADVSLLHSEGDSRINILLLGIGGPGHEGANLTDTILLASVDPIKDKATLISIPRDLWVKIPRNGYQKINAAYADAVDQSTSKTQAGQEGDGIEVLDNTLKPVLDGIHINYHVLLDFSAFRQMVDALGGVTVNVPETLYDPTVAWENHYNPVIAKKGLQTFNGKQALLYVRSRETSSDFARGERQRLVIAAIKQKALSAGTFANPLKISSLLDSLGQNVYTDFSGGDIKCLYRQISTIPSTSIQSLDMVTPPNALLTTGNMNGLSIVEPRAGLFDYSDIHKFLHGALKDGLIVKENAHIAVYNATDTSGLASAETAKLKEYGYKITKTDSTATISNPATTTIIDLSKGKNKYTRNYLQNRFGVTIVNKLPSDLGITPSADTSFVIILGNDVSSDALQE